MCGVAGLAPERLAISKVLLRAAANKKVCGPGTAWPGLAVKALRPPSAPYQEARENYGYCLVNPCHGSKPKPSCSSSRLQGHEIALQVPLQDPNHVFHLSLNTLVPVPHKDLPGDAPATELHLHATEQLCKLGRSGSTSPAPPDRPSSLHHETIKTSFVSLPNNISWECNLNYKVFGCCTGPDPCCFRSHLTHLKPCWGSNRQVG